jgi:rhodanese-related sulfurtransferase
MTINSKKNSPKQFYFNPIFIGIILITIITSYFLWQTFTEEQKLKDLEKKLMEEKKAAGKIDVELASAEEIYQWIGNKNIQLVDIRPSSEYSIKHIESSINLPLNELTKSLAKIDKNKKIIIIDKEDSKEGKIISEHLKSEGLVSKYLKGGILNYARQNYPLITNGNPKNITDQMKVSLITAEQIKEKMLSGKIFSFIDTRQTSIFKINNIDGSQNIPLEKIEQAKKYLPPRTILLYDDDPMRSFQAGVKLYDMGISNVYVCSDNYTLFKKILFTEKLPGKEKEDLTHSVDNKN